MYRLYSSCWLLEANNVSLHIQLLTNFIDEFVVRVGPAGLELMFSVHGQGHVTG